MVKPSLERGEQEKKREETGRAVPEAAAAARPSGEYYESDPPGGSG
ncbi:hypothetical protein ABZ896_02665 [Streptomyces sp. NPDC047072]